MTIPRRQFGLSLADGCFGIALASLLQRDARAEGKWAPPDGQPHFPPKAKRVIWLFMNGGVSHLESFDPKPMLAKHAGQTIASTPWKGVQDPEKLKRARVVIVNDANGQQRNTLFAPQVGFKKCGKNGTDVSDFFPHLQQRADDLAVVRSMYTVDDNHGAQTLFSTGRHMLDGSFPSFGAWVHYGLGSLNDNLPQYVALGPHSMPAGFGNTREGDYLGPAHDPAPLRVDPAKPLDFGIPEGGLTAAEQETLFGLVGKLDARSAERFPGDPVLAARIKSYELAFRMQKSIPEIMDFSQETAETKRLYGLEDPAAKEFGMQLLAARRLAERGVRFIQIQHGKGGAGAWDAHGELKKNHAENARKVDQPIAGLLVDLRRRGLLDDTLVLFATEFGRTPGSQGNGGRDHHPYAFSVWLAGGGVKGGIVHGATDEIGFHAVESPHYVTDVHATIMRQLGLDTRRLEIPGRKRLEIDHGTPIAEILA